MTDPLLDFHTEYCPLCGSHDSEWGEQKTPRRASIEKAVQVYPLMGELVQAASYALQFMSGSDAARDLEDVLTRAKEVMK